MNEKKIRSCLTHHPCCVLNISTTNLSISSWVHLYNPSSSPTISSSFVHHDDQISNVDRWALLKPLWRLVYIFPQPMVPGTVKHDLNVLPVGPQCRPFVELLVEPRYSNSSKRSGLVSGPRFPEWQLAKRLKDAS